MMSRRLRLGMVALGVYLASVGSMLALHVDGGFPDWLNRESFPGLSMSLVVGVPAAAVGAFLVLAAATAASGEEAGHGGRGRSFPAGERNSAPRLSGAGLRIPDSGNAEEQVSLADSRARAAPERRDSPKERHRRADRAARGSRPGRAAAEAPVGDGVRTHAPGNEGRSPVGGDRASFGGSHSHTEAPASLVLDAEALKECWRRYRDEGDGHFRADGLRAELAESGFSNEVIEGRDLGAGDHVLVVHTGASGGRCYLVPSFVEAPAAVDNWFEDRGVHSLSRRVNEIRVLAEGRCSADGVELVKKGVVS